MTNTITIEINQKDFFKNWEPEQTANLSEEDKEEIIKFFVNKGICLKRDNYKCQNEYCTQEYNSIELIEERRKYITCHHIIPRRDFKENPKSMEKRLGCGCNDLDNLITLCKPCHKGYERARLTIKINGQEYKLERVIYDIKSIIKEGKTLRKELKRLGNVGWGRLTEKQRIHLIYLLMKWLNGEMVYEMSD